MTIRLTEEQSLMLLDEGSWDQAAVLECVLLELTSQGITAVVAIVLSDGDIACYRSSENELENQNWLP